MKLCMYSIDVKYKPELCYTPIIGELFLKKFFSINMFSCIYSICFQGPCLNFMAPSTLYYKVRHAYHGHSGEAKFIESFGCKKNGFGFKFILCDIRQPNNRLPSILYTCI